MSIQAKLEKTAKSLSRFAGLVGKSLSTILPLSNANVYFDVTDDDSYTLEIRDLSARVLEGKVEPLTVELKGSREAFLRLFDGEKSFESLWVNGEIKIVGVRNHLLQALIIGMLVSM